MRRCLRCEKEKPDDEFRRSKNDHPMRTCNACGRLERYARQNKCSIEEAADHYVELDKKRELKKRGLKKCKWCEKIKPLSEFRHVMMGGKRGKNSEGKKYETAVRYCNDCKTIESQANMQDQRDRRYFPHILSDIRNRAKRKGLAFDLSPEYIQALYEQQKGLCAVTGLPMNFDRSGWSERNPYMASLDRIVPDKGYLKGNVRWVLFAVNMAMSNWGESLFRTIAEAYLAKQSQLSQV